MCSCSCFSTEVTFARGCNGKWNSEILMVIILFDQHLCEVVYIPLLNLSVVYIPLLNLSYFEVGWRIFEKVHRLSIKLDWNTLGTKQRGLVQQLILTLATDNTTSWCFAIVSATFLIKLPLLEACLMKLSFASFLIVHVCMRGPYFSICILGVIRLSG